ncbi:uncharacterized protein LOC111004352 [Pieris rapae]|uniref:uncharacterized protein LOC111004352 n=1 Tax=Pieris rapae TaxID=64459 RepID=UPI001E27F69C|nr:uncharacterized protein LOC111004352 [Pieris rapae]
MAAKSPTTSVKSREIIGGDQFSQRREIFEKHNTVFLPLPSPGATTTIYREVEPIITSNHGKTTSNFKRNTSGYSSMRESRSDDRPQFEFRTRKYSDNFTSELNQSDDVDYRYSTVERTRRLSKMRRDFLNSNLHEPNESNFARSGVRASMPTANVTKYKVESPKIHKFPFAEPYSTPTPMRRILVDLGSPDTEGTEEKENLSPEARRKHQSLPHEQGSPKTDRQKLFEELVKRYSPQRKPVDWTLPPTRPKVVGSVPKSTSSGPESIDNTDTASKDEVFENNESTKSAKVDENQINQEIKPHIEILHNGPETVEEIPEETRKETSKISLTEIEENDFVPELSHLKRQLSRESAKRPPKDVIVDLTIPALIDQMTKEGEKIEHQKTNGKKVKRKRSFLDKLLGRKKDVRSEK